VLNSPDPVPDDPFLAELIETVRDDPETIGLLLHGSRSVGRHRADSDYDLIRIVTADAYEARRVALEEDRDALAAIAVKVGT